MNLGTPEGCLEEADRLQLSSLTAFLIGDIPTSVRHADRCKELRLLAAKLERDEARSPT